MEAAISLAVFEDFGFCNTFAALDATFGDVRTEFLDKVKPPFKMDVSLLLNLSSALIVSAIRAAVKGILAIMKWR